MMRYGHYESMPSVWNDKCGWLLYDDEWREHHIAELVTKAGMISGAAFKRAYPDIPPIPAPALAPC